MMSRTSLVTLLTLAAFGCKNDPPAAETPVEAPPVSPSAQAAVAPAPSASTALVDDTVGEDVGPETPSESPPYDGPLLGALFFQTPIYSDPEWPSKDPKSPNKSRQIGYIRQGGRVPVKPEPKVKPSCEAGWYELVVDPHTQEGRTSGGWVCGKYATIDMNHPKLKHAPHAPFEDRALPYEYGYNTGNGTPLYGSVPSREERIAAEPWLAPKPKPKPSEDLENASVTLTAAVSSGDEPAGEAKPTGSAAAESKTPWYLQSYDGGVKPKVTLDELRGEAGGPVLKRMVRGFFLSLDRPFSSNGSRWYRTTQSVIAPADRVMLWKQPTDFHGLWAEGWDPPSYAKVLIGKDPKPVAEVESERMPAGENGLYGFVLSTKGKKYQVTEDEKSVSVLGDLPRFSRAPLTGKSATIKGARYDQTTLGYWLKASEGTRTTLATRPEGVGDQEKWIDVSIGAQTLVAYVGDQAVFATLVSTGRTSSDKSQNHPTPTGAWRIREKHIAATMDGDVASDGPYSIEDVPWIQYFHGSYAVHGAFWHAEFGRKKSHGCVNLAPVDARAVFDFTEPRIPQGWHAAWSTDKHPGTMVVVRD